MKLIDLWNSNDSADWLQALDNYWNFVKPKNIEVEKKLNNLDYKVVKQMSVNEFYEFLHDHYFEWKFTDSRFFSKIIGYLKVYVNEEKLHELENVKTNLFNFDLTNITKGLTIAQSIRGLGIPGASGLLSLLYPNDFGTVDQFVLKALQEIENLPEVLKIKNINPNNILLKDGVILINIMRRKASELNNIFNTNFWTPRKIDMILWTYGR